ncbi:hypothetical protein [Luteimicrobium subarcticum]|uniref:Uncharacterized protein n=1 Tax=Luteimicrobium subarcticum TaxID=620910 RepID=A0A2M8WUA8_9MICO|nr:hypothetical protein [Luteimicrobium subarcticum]PJI94446.1 hypothetical protein CLV34_0282 [Luteimicrobium subarcticum]
MVQVLVWMLLALIAAAAVLVLVLRVERRANPEVSSGDLRGFVADFRAGWGEIRAERVARKNPEMASEIALRHQALQPVDSPLGDVFDWSEPDDAPGPRWS